MKKHKKLLIIGIIVVILLAVFFMLAKSQKDTQSLRIFSAINKRGSSQKLTTIDNQKMEGIPFCGMFYLADEKIINNVDIIETIARIAIKNNWLCKNIALGNFQENGIGLAQKKEVGSEDSYLIVLYHKDSYQEKNDPFNQSPFIFKFDFKNDKIFYQDQFTGSFKLLGAISQ